MVMGGDAESGGDENGENAVAIDGNEEMRVETRTADRDDYGKEEAITGAGVMNNRIPLSRIIGRETTRIHLPCLIYVLATESTYLHAGDQIENYTICVSMSTASVSKDLHPPKRHI